jgi:hypothetical protein
VAKPNYSSREKLKRGQKWVRQHHCKWKNWKVFSLVKKRQSTEGLSFHCCTCKRSAWQATYMSTKPIVSF